MSAGHDDVQLFHVLRRFGLLLQRRLQRPRRPALVPVAAAGYSAERVYPSAGSAAAAAAAAAAAPDAADAAAELPADYEHVVPVAGWHGQSAQRPHVHGWHAVRCAERRLGLLHVPWWPSAVPRRLAHVQFYRYHRGLPLQQRL